MKIIFLDFDDIKNPLLGAGQAKATVEVGSRLAKMGHEVVSICSRYPGSKDRVENGIRYHHIGLATTNIRLNNWIYILSVPFALIGLTGDIVIECFTAPMSTLCSPLFTRIPVVALPTSFDADRFAKQYRLPFHWIERYCLRFYKYFMPYTKAYADKMRRYNPAIISEIIPEGVGSEFFRIRQKQPKYILFLGRIEMNQKGIDFLLEAFASVRKLLKYPLVIAGKGPDEAKMHDHIGKLGLAGQVRFVGPAYGQKKAKLLSEALYVAMPSRNEGFSLFSLEALASGLPLVTFNIDGFSWTTTQPVVKAKAMTVRGYAQAMLHAAKKEVYVKLRKSARKSVRQFTWETVSQAFADFFKTVLEKEALRQHKGGFI